MNILIVGSGGREHALAWKIAQSNRTDEIFIAPGNAGTAEFGTNVDIDVMDTETLIEFAQSNAIDFTIVGPEDPLCSGIISDFEAAGLKAFGPDKESAQFEGSKKFTKKFLEKHEIPTAKYIATTELNEALEYLETMSYPVVLKVDGLCKGKGVVIAKDQEEAEETLRSMLEGDQCGESDKEVVIEEFLDGDERSLLCFVSNNKIVPMEMARDYKKSLDHDEGANTGGVGAYSPGLEILPDVQASIDESLVKIEKGLKEDGFQFHGILFIGYMLHEEQAKVLEFNVRFGDPETEVLLPRLKSDLLEVMLKTMEGTLEESDLIWEERYSLGVVLHSKGYPDRFEKNIPITKIPANLKEGEWLFHNGTLRNQAGELTTNGGRVLTPVAMGNTLEEARENAYRLVEQIECESLIYRTDIGLI